MKVFKLLKCFDKTDQNLGLRTPSATISSSDPVWTFGTEEFAQFTRLRPLLQSDSIPPSIVLRHTDDESGVHLTSVSQSKLCKLIHEVLGRQSHKWTISPLKSIQQDHSNQSKNLVHSNKALLLAFLVFEIVAGARIFRIAPWRKPFYFLTFYSFFVASNTSNTSTPLQHISSARPSPCQDSMASTLGAMAPSSEAAAALLSLMMAAENEKCT